MATLKKVDAGWKGLGEILNRIIDEVNGGTPIEGDGIRIVDTARGKLISVAAQAQAPGGVGGAGGGGTTTQQIVATQSHDTITQITWRGVKWQGVDVVDPATCVHSTITVLVNTGNAGDTATIHFSDLIWVNPTV